MKRKMLLLISTFLIIVGLAGCGDSLKMEPELLTDLSAEPGFYVVEGSEVTELSIIKRLTDEVNKTDKVYVCVRIDHPAATATKAYVMNYTRYNEGWLLDGIEEYHGKEVEWTTVPKQAPTSERIMEELISFSNYQIDTDYAEWNPDGEFPRYDFFEEGKYATTVYTGDFISDIQYDCVVETERVFEYVTVEETQLLHFTFDSYNFEWYLSAEEIVRLTGDWHLAGQWNTPYYGESISFDFIHGYYGTGAYENFNGTWFYADAVEDFEVELSFPTTRSMPWEYIRIGNWPMELYISVFPGKLWCVDWNHDREFVLTPAVLDDPPEALETVGIIDMPTGEDAESYRNVAKEFFSRVFIERDTTYLKEVWHPTAEQERLSLLEERISAEWYPASTITHMYTQVVAAEDPLAKEITESLQEQGVYVEEVAVSIYCLEYTSEGEIEYTISGVIMAKQGDAIYVIGID